MIGLLSKIINFFSNDKEEERKWHWDNPFQKGTENYDLYEEGSNNYSKYLRREMPNTVYTVSVWIEGHKLERNGWNKFYTRLVYTDKEEAALIAIQTAKVRNLDIEDYRIMLSIDGHDEMEIPIY